MNDVWALDLSSFKWFKQACQGAAPRPRDKASAAVCAGVMVIFGGHTQGKRLNDLCVLDLSSFSWSSWTSVMGQPSPREAAALCVGHGNLLFLHGGASNFGLDDLWVYAFLTFYPLHPYCCETPKVITLHLMEKRVSGG